MAAVSWAFLDVRHVSRDGEFISLSASSCSALSFVELQWYSLRAEYLPSCQLVADHALLSRCRATKSPTLALFRAPRVRIHSTPITSGCSARREQSRRPEAGNCGTYGEPSILPICTCFGNLFSGLQGCLQATMLCAEVHNLQEPHMRCLQSPEHFATMLVRVHPLKCSKAACIMFFK